MHFIAYNHGKKNFLAQPVRALLMGIFCVAILAGFPTTGYAQSNFQQAELDSGAAIHVTKSAEPAGLVQPGTFLTYTLVIENRGVVPLTNVQVTDTLPLGLTPVAGSTVITYWNNTAQQITNHNVGDSFDTNDYSGNNSTSGDSWRGSWVEIGDDLSSNPNASFLRIIGQTVRFDADEPKSGASLVRTVDLQTAFNATLSVDYTVDGQGTADAAVDVEIYNGTTWHSLLTLPGNVAIQNRNLITDITALLNPLGDTKIRLRSSGDNADWHQSEQTNLDIYFDNFKITWQEGIDQPVGFYTVTGGDPPLITAGEGYEVAVGHAMTLTHQVSVSTITPAGVLQYLNVAQVSSDQLSPATAMAMGAISDTYDWGDLPQNYQTTDALTITTIISGPHHPLDGITFLGTVVDAEADGAPSEDALGDDSERVAGSGPDDEDGIVFLSPIMAGRPFTLEVIAGGAGFLNGWIDFDGNGLFQPGEQIQQNQSLAPGVHQLAYIAPLNSVTGTLYSRFRFSSLAEENPASVGLGHPGEVEDYALILAYDYDDLPATYGSASHLMIEPIFLGTLVTSELSSLPSQNADGDSDDGITFPAPIVAGQPFTIQVTASITGYLNSWIDFDSSGTFESAEQIANDDMLVAGTNTIIITAPTSLAVDHLYGRFRFAAYPGEATAPTGSAYSGEVESFRIAVDDRPTPTLTPTPTQTTMPTPTDTATATETPTLTSTPTLIPTPTLTPTSTLTLALASTQEPTMIPSPSPPSTMTPTVMPTVKPTIMPTLTPTVTPTVTPAATPINTATDTPEPTLIPPTDTPLPTSTNTAVPTVTPTNTVTHTATNVPTSTPTSTPTTSPTDTATPTVEPTATSTLTPLPTLTPTSTVTQVATESPTLTFTPTSTMLPTPSPTFTPLFVIPPIPVPEAVLVGNRVWYDNNGDGLQGDGLDSSSVDEPGVPGVKVALFLADGTPAIDLMGRAVAPTESGVDGYYFFDNLPAGNYYVRFNLRTLPEGYQPSALSPQLNRWTGQSTTTKFLQAGEKDFTLDMGIVAPVAVGNRVWYDYDGNGLQRNVFDEPGVPGVTVVLLNADGTLPQQLGGASIAPQITNERGEYRFENLPPGDYRILFELETLPINHFVTQPRITDVPAFNTGNQADSDVDPKTGLSVATGPIRAGDENLDIDMGILPMAGISIGDRVWLDADGNGLQDGLEEEAGVAGIAVRLFKVDGSPVVDLNGDPVGVQMTDQFGNYRFEKLAMGNYYVEFDAGTLPVGTVATQPNRTDDLSPATSDQVDSDAVLLPASRNLQTGASGFLLPGDSNLTLDLGITQEEAVRVGDRVWFDHNGDGLQGDFADEPGVAGIEVRLFSADGTPVNDMNDEPVGLEITNNNGEYLFDNLPTGDYYIQYDLATLPLNYRVTQPSAFSGQLSASNQQPTTNNQQPITNNQLDSNANPSTGETGTTGQLQSGTEDLTLDMGLVAVNQTVRIGDRVWLDANRDGWQNAGERGVSGVTVKLYETASGIVQAESVTDSNGNYLFDELEADDYYVQFDLATIPANLAIIEENAKVDLETGQSQPTGALTGGQDFLTLDMGLYLLENVQVGDRVWYDLNSNGLQDSGELGVESVTVTLYDLATGRPVPDIAPAQTDINGYYRFRNLPAGDYYVAYDLETLPMDYGVTIPDRTIVDNGQLQTSDLLDSDADPGTGRTSSTGPLANDELDMSLDMGIVKLPGVTVGDYVWFDENGDGVQNPGEQGVPGVTVYLYNQITGEAVATPTGEQFIQVTDANGAYLFTHLPPGQYYALFDLDTIPADYLVSPAGAEVSDTADSDPESLIGASHATRFLINSDTDRTVDLGIYRPMQVTGQVWLDPDGDGRRTLGENGLANVGVTLVHDVTNEPITTTTTNATGHYLFNNLQPGSYHIQLAPATLPPSSVILDPSPFNHPILQTLEVGGQVWMDSNRNGIQDEDEGERLTDVTVRLYNRAGTINATAKTDSDGHYLFNDLLPGAYYIQFDLTTLPPDYVVTRANGTGDLRDSDASPSSGWTGSSGLLRGGMARTSFDMGVYRLPEDEVRVGGQVWEDRDLDGEMDGDEQRLSGQTIALYRLEQPDIQPLTTITDADGNYLFKNLPPGNYFAKLDPTALPDDVMALHYYGQGALTVEPANSDRANSGPLAAGEQALNLNIAIRFAGQLSGLAWSDENGDGLHNHSEPPRSNIEVRLYDAEGAMIGETRTNTEGHYNFTNLEPGTYVAEALPPTIYRLSPPHQGADQTLDSDIEPATGLSTSLFVGSGQHLAHINVGLYQGTAFTNVLWLDQDGDGLQDEDESGISGVTVHLYRTSGDLLVGTTTTDAQGRYGFATLAAGEYYLIFETSAEFTANQQVQAADSNAPEIGVVRGPTISLSARQHLALADVGLTQAAAIGNYVWLDTNKDGVVDRDEPGVADVAVHLLDEAGRQLAKTVTDSSGRYEFVVAPGRYQLQFAPDNSIEFTLVNGGDDRRDSDVDPKSGRTGLITVGPGVTDFSNFAGFIVSPTAIQLLSLSATETRTGVAIQWQTGEELATFGFELRRSRDGTLENAVTITEDVILAQGNDSSIDVTYQFWDRTARVGQSYSYWLVEIQTDEQQLLYGPARVVVGEVVLGTSREYTLFLPLIQR